MRILFIKMRRDLLKMWTQFLSVFLMAFLGVVIYAGLEGIWCGIQTETDSYFKDANLASAWVYGSGISEKQFDSIKKIKNVEAASPAMEAAVKVKFCQTDGAEPDLQLVARDDDNISKLFVTDGKKFSNHGLGVWLDCNFAGAYGIRPEDKIKLSFGESERELTVCGLVMSPEYIYYTGSSTNIMPDHKLHGFAFTNSETAKQLFGGIKYNEIRVKLTDNADTAQFSKNAENILGKTYMGYSDRNSLSGVANLLLKTAQIKKMSILFSAVFILLALLTMQTTMKRLVENQRTQVGTLKAMGYKDWQLKLHYALYGLTTGLLGGIAGLILAPYTVTPVIMDTQRASYTLPIWQGRATPVSYILVVLIALCCTGAAMLAVGKALKGMPAETMRGAAIKSGKKVWLEKIPQLWRCVPFDWKWSLRDISRGKVRSIMGVIGVCGCMMLLMASFGMQNSLDYANKYIYKTQYTYGMEAVLSPAFSQNNRDELEKIAAGGYQWTQENSIKISGMPESQNNVLTVLDSGNYVHFENVGGTSANLPGEGAFITRKAAKDLGLKKGDTVRFKLFGDGDKEYANVKISDIVAAPSPQGLFFSKQAWEKLGKTFKPTAMLIGSGSIRSKIKDLPYIREASEIGDQYESARQLFLSVGVIFTLLKAAAVLLAAVILYNLGILSYTERIREYATLKVLGFYRKEIRSFALRENILTTAVGWLIGIPVGMCFLRAYLKVVSMFNFDWQPKLTPLSFLLATLITVGCSIGVNLFISRKVKKLDMVEALKSVE